MSWELVDNPAIPLAHGPLVPACHDGSPFVTIRCNCGEYLHMHETQLAASFERHDELRLRCPSCGTFLAMPGGFVLDAFAEIRQAMEATTDG